MDSSQGQGISRHPIVVFATNLSGDFLAGARIQRLAARRDTRGGLVAGAGPVPSADLAALRSLLVAKGPAPSRLNLQSEDLPCLLLLEAEGHETTLLDLVAGEGDVAVPLRNGERLEFDVGLLRATNFESGMLTIRPTVAAADGSHLQKEIALIPRAPDRWAVAVWQQQRVTASSRSLGDLPRDQAFTVYLEDDRRQLVFDPLQVVAPAQLDFAWRRADGCTLVFSAPLPSAGTVVFTPQDRRSEEPMLGGHLPLAAGATTAFIPCAIGRRWFLDGCGIGWQFAVPIVVEVTRDDPSHAVQLIDAQRILSIVGEEGLDSNGIQILFAEGPPDRPEFERVTFDPMARGPRVVPDVRGWLVRDLPPTKALFAYLEPCNAVLPLDAAGQTRVVIQQPKTRASFRLPDAERELLRAELLMVPPGDSRVCLDQWLPIHGEGTWFQTTSRQLRRDQLLAGMVPIPGTVGSRYRLRVMLPGREWVVELE